MAEKRHKYEKVLTARRARAWLLPVLFLLATAATVRAGDYTYTTNSDNTLTITDYTGPGGEVVIPSAIEGRAVTIIGDDAFHYVLFDPRATNLTSVVIPDSVTSIGNHAFETSFRLTSVMIGNGVTSIGNNAFSHCGSLTNVTIPNSVTSVGDNAFYLCYNLANVTIGNSVTSIGAEAFVGTSLTAITVDAGNSVYSSVDGVLFNKNQTMLIQYPTGKAVSIYTIPDSVTSIGNSAFKYCSNLTSVTIPDSVTSIGVDAFGYCNSLTSVMIGTGVISIGNGAFEYCRSLIGVYFTGNTPGIGSDVFKHDDNATVYYLPGTTGWGLTFGGRPAMPWWDGPQISANNTREDVSLNRGDTLKIAVAMDADNHAGVPVDWWVLARAGSAWFYLNSSLQWTQFDGSFLNCHPVYQGPLFNLPATQVLNVRGLQTGSYTFWFTVDYPMDGILNVGGYILLDSVNVTVLN